MPGWWILVGLSIGIYRSTMKGQLEGPSFRRKKGGRNREGGICKHCDIYIYVYHVLEPPNRNENSKGERILIRVVQREEEEGS